MGNCAARADDAFTDDADTTVKPYAVPPPALAALATSAARADARSRAQATALAMLAAYRPTMPTPLVMITEPEMNHTRILVPTGAPAVSPGPERAALGDKADR